MYLNLIDEPLSSNVLQQQKLYIILSIVIIYFVIK
jgi:hypothetical protein